MKFSVPANSEQEYNNEYSSNNLRKISSAKRIDFQGFFGKKTMNKNKSQNLRTGKSNLKRSSVKNSKSKYGYSHSVLYKKKPQKNRYNSFSKMNSNRKKIENLRNLMESMNTTEEKIKSDRVRKIRS